VWLVGIRTVLRTVVVRNPPVLWKALTWQLPGLEAEFHPEWICTGKGLLLQGGPFRFRPTTSPPPPRFFRAMLGRRLDPARRGIMLSGDNTN
jgi:hypothetical protein